MVCMVNVPTFFNFTFVKDEKKAELVNKISVLGQFRVCYVKIFAIFRLVLVRKSQILFIF